jgi:hypothetical protein
LKGKTVAEYRRAISHWTAGLQGGFYALTGIWPVLHIESFLRVTGPKHDLWLVEAFGLVLFTVGAVLIHAAWRRQVEPSLAMLGLALALTLLAVDVMFVMREVISPVYLADGLAELAIACSWVSAYLLESRAERSQRGATLFGERRALWLRGMGSRRP